MKTLYLCAAGNVEGIRLTLVVQNAERRWERIVLLDDDAALHGQTKMGLTIEGAFDLLRDRCPSTFEVVNLVTRTTARRAAAHARIADYGAPFASLFHPSVDIFGCDVGAGVTAYQFATLGAEATVGDGTVVLMGAVVGHRARTGAMCVIAPNAVINARAVLGDRVYVGTNATILPEVRVGDGATIGANSVVIEDVPANASVMGSPARDTSVYDDSEAQRPAHVSGLANEATVLAIVREVLQIDVQVGDNLFSLGCDSLRALRIAERLRTQANVKISPVDLYRSPTVSALVSSLTRGSQSAGEDRARARLRARGRPAA